MRMRILALVAFLTLAGAVAAAESGLHAFNPPPGDVSVDYLSQIFGPVIDGLKATTSQQGAQAAGDTGQTVIGAMMSVFNTAVLFLGMLFVFYTTIKSTVDSAHSGELLGKKMSEVWVPIRTFCGAGLLLPMSSGFSVLQMAVLWLALQGVGVASAVWNAGMDRLAINGTLGYVSVPDARPLAASILRNQVCMEAMNKQYLDSGRATRIEFVSDSIRIVVGGAPDRNSQQFMVESYIDKSYAWRANDRQANADVCGSIQFQNTDQTKDLAASLRGPLLIAHTAALRAMIDELKPVAQQIVATFNMPPAGALDLAAAHYKTTLQEAAQKAIAATPDAAKSSFIASAKEAGWVSAGAWWSRMTALNDTIQNAVNALPASQASRIEELEVGEALTTYRDAITMTEEYIKNRAGAPRAEAMAEIDVKSIRTMDDFWRMLSYPAMKALDSLTQRIAGANTSPVTQLRSIGNDIVSVGLVIKGAVFVAAGIVGSKALEWTAGSVFNLADALKTVSGSIEWLSNTLWACGALLAYYLPAVPVIWWAMGVIRWLASVAEAVLAAPLMAAMQIHPDGDDIVGRSGPGYMLILSMVMQPALLLFALVLAILMTYPAGALVNMLFLQMVSGTAANSGVGLVGLVSWTALYVVMMVLDMHSCFALVGNVPDNVMRFVASVAGAQGIVKTGDDAYQRLESGAGGAGSGLARGGLPEGRGGSGKGRTENGISDADLMPQQKGD